LVSSFLNHAPYNIQERYKPLRFPSTLHDFPPKDYKYLPRFDGEIDKIYAKKHMETFENFIDVFEIEHDNVFMRIFSQSLYENSKTWFRHLHLESISSWDELREAFLRFWGERKLGDLLL
jgi:hypothetical protein